MFAPRRDLVRHYWFVDPKLQVALAFRVIMYWLLCVTSTAALLLLWCVAYNPDRPYYVYLDDFWFYVGSGCVVSLIFLPLVLIDILRFSHRFAGPLLHLRHALRRLARGEHVAPLEFREDDYWHEIAADFNSLLATLPQNSQTQPPQESPEQEPLASGANA